MADTELAVEICDATLAPPRRLSLRVMPGTTLGAAVRQGLPHLDLTSYRVGIYGKLKTLETVLRERDRVEIYRPLLADPKDARRRRARR